MDIREDVGMRSCDGSGVGVNTFSLPAEDPMQFPNTVVAAHQRRAEVGLAMHSRISAARTYDVIITAEKAVVVFSRVASIYIY